jgi:hypothetical protein
MGIGLPIIGDLFGAVAGPFTAAAGWAIDSVIAAITTWVIGGVIALIEAVWSVIDMSTNPTPRAEWFSGEGSSPFELALGIGGVMLLLTTLAAVLRAVLAGSPGGITKAVGRDLPAAVLMMVATVAVTAALLDLTNAMSDWVWAGTRDDAKAALDTLSLTLRGGLPGLHFVAVAMALMVLLALLFLWVVLYVREALLYLVVVFAAAFAWPMMVFPPLRDTARKVGELLLALIVCKPVIALALSVGVSAMGSAGRNDENSTVGQLGTLVAGVIVFGLAAFMPYLVWKLLPIAAAAVVAQGVASAPLRAVHQTAQTQHYARQLTSGGKTPGKPASGDDRSATNDGGRPHTGAPTGPAGGPGGGGGGAAAVAGPTAAVAVAAMAAKKVKDLGTATAELATAPGDGVGAGRG